MASNEVNEVEGNQDDSVEQSSKFLVNISGYYMNGEIIDASIHKLEAAIQARIERGEEFRRRMLQRMETLQMEVDQPVDDVNVEALKAKLQGLADFLNNANFDKFPTYSGGRRNFRRYSRRKRQ